MAYYNFMAEGSGNKAYYLGELAHGATMNVASKYEDYANLTAENFVVVPQSNSASGFATNTNYVNVYGWTERRDDTNTANYTAPSINYNPATGQLSFSSTLVVGGFSVGRDNDGSSGRWCYTYPSATVGLTAKVYLLINIESL